MRDTAIQNGVEMAVHTLRAVDVSQAEPGAFL
jgi:hypothetical protein